MSQKKSKQWWFTTDLHLGHKMLVERGYRPLGYESEIWAGWGGIGYDDMVICLGDVCFGPQADWHQQIQSMPGRKILVRGNHDSQSVTWYLDHGWSFVCDSFQVEKFGLRWLFSHRPEAYHGQFDLNVFGHFHNNEHRSSEPEMRALLTEKHKLLALEKHGYAPVSFDWMFRNLESMSLNLTTGGREDGSKEAVGQRNSGSDKDLEGDRSQANIPEENSFRR